MQIEWVSLFKGTQTHDNIKSLGKVNKKSKLLKVKNVFKNQSLLKYKLFFLLFSPPNVHNVNNIFQ